eukprot:946098-Amphidinium_carterae.1
MCAVSLVLVGLRELCALFFLLHLLLGGPSQLRQCLEGNSLRLVLGRDRETKNDNQDHAEREPNGSKSI